MKNVANSATKSNKFMVVPLKTEQNKGRKSWRIWRGRIGTMLTAFTVMLATGMVAMRIMGIDTYAVLSGSMNPIMPVGSMIYVKPVDYKNLQVGDVISYVADSNKAVVTHRIVDIEIDEENQDLWRFKTKGDANEMADGKLVHYQNVLGTPIITIPLLGYIMFFLQRPPGVYIGLAGGILLLAWIFLPEMPKERRKTARKQRAI